MVDRRPQGLMLEEMTWVEAEEVLRPDTVVVIPIGAAAKEHGPHLRLDNDRVLAEYLTARVVEASAVVVIPTITYHHYPAFVEYPGSTTLGLETARDLVVDLCRGIARFGPRRFYALNTGVSTMRALEPTATILAEDRVLFRYTDILRALGPVEGEVAEQEGGSHADEIETSMMLHVAPDRVDMTRAVWDYRTEGSGGLTRDPAGARTYSPTGIWGDPTLATAEKGKVIVEALVDAILVDIEDLRTT